MPKYGNKPIPVDNNEISLTNEDNISRIQIAALAETTDRSTSKPKSIISGQQATGGGGSGTPHTLTTNVDGATGPFISNGNENLAIFGDLYDTAGAAKFLNTTINGILIQDVLDPADNSVLVTAKQKFLFATVGESYNQTTNTICLYIPNVDDGTLGGTSTAGQYVYSQEVQYTPDSVRGTRVTRGKKSDKWLVPEALMLLMCDLDPTTDTIDDITVNHMTTVSQYLTDTGLTNTPADFLWELGKTPTIVGNQNNPGKLDPNDPSKWWVKVKDALPVLAEAPVGRIENSADCVDDPAERATGYMTSQLQTTFEGTPLKVTTSPVTVAGTILDPDTLSTRPDQFQLDIAWDAGIFSNILATVFKNAQYDNELDGKLFKVEVLKAAVTKDQSGGAPPAIQVYMDGRPEQLDPNDATQSKSNQYEEESVIPAINRIHQKTHLAKGQAVSLNQFLTNQVIGNPNLSQSDKQSTTYKSLSAAGYDPGSQLAIDRLNLIPVLSGDRLVEAHFLYDSDGNQVLDDLGVPKIGTISHDVRSSMTEQGRRDFGLKHPRSATPPTTVLEALWSQWTHVTNLTTDTYGISALTDVDIIDDKHELLDPIKLNSFIENFNLLYTMTDGLSGQMDSIKLALSGIAPGDTLIDPLSTYSVYQNLNNIYTNTLANSACCENVSLSAAQNETDIASLSAFALKLESQLGVGGGGGITMCDGEDICTVLTGLHDTLINLNNPGGFDIHFPSSGLKKHFKPDQKYDPTGTACEGVVKPDSDTYKYHESVTGAADIEYHMWHHVDNSWNIGTQVCDVTMKIDNPDNLPIDQLTTPPGDPIVQITGPYDDFTTKLKRVIDYVDNPPVTPADIQDLDDQILDIEKDIEALSGCCDLNTSNVVELSAFVHGDPNTNQLHDDLLPRENLVSVINKLYSQISSLEESGGDPTNAAEIVKNLLKININTTNISTISGDLITLGDDVTTISGDVIHNTNLIDINTNNINNINLNIDQIETDVDAISGKVEDLEQCCEDSLKIDDISLHAVTLTGDQFINGEKTFADTLTVSTSAVIGDNMTIGEGPTAFSVCSDQATGLSYIQIHNIITDPVSVVALPAGTIYAKTVQDGGETRKQLYIS